MSGHFNKGPTHNRKGIGGMGLLHLLTHFSQFARLRTIVPHNGVLLYRRICQRFIKWQMTCMHYPACYEYTCNSVACQAV